MAENEKKNSPAFQAMLDFSNAVKEASPKTPEGKAEYYVSGFKNRKFENKEGKTIRDAVFYLNGHSNENISFVVSMKGTLKNATVLIRDGEENKREFIGKDYDKLAEVCKDRGLVIMAGKMNWEKAPAKEAEAPEAEAEEMEM